MVIRFENALHSRFCASCRLLAFCVLSLGVAAALIGVGYPLAAAPVDPLPSFEVWLDATATDYAATTRAGPPVEILLR